MSSERLPPAIDLAVGASPSLTGICAAAYAAAIAAVALSGLAWPIRAVLILALLGFAAWWMAARALVLAPDSIVRLVWRPDGECEWLERRGRWCHGNLVPGVLVLPALVVLRLRRGRHSRTVCLAGDAVDEKALRRLRMRLRVSPPPTPPPPARRLAGGLRQRMAKRSRQNGFALNRRRGADR